jgi:hypothetical protein
MLDLLSARSSDSLRTCSSSFTDRRLRVDPSNRRVVNDLHDRRPPALLCDANQTCSLKASSRIGNRVMIQAQDPADVPKAPGRPPVFALAKVE